MPTSPPTQGTSQPSKSSTASTQGTSPTLSSSNLSQIIAQSLALSAQNAVTAQQQANLLHQASTAMGIGVIFESSPSNSVKNLPKLLQDIQAIADAFKKTEGDAQGNTTSGNNS